MNFTRNKMILYMLIIANGIDFILPWPIFQRHVNDDSYTQNLKTTSVVQESRYSRQVVQPTWLNVGQKEPDVDPTVYVNEKSLQEADEIRKAIQKAVDEGTFFVTGQEPDRDTAMESPGTAMQNLPNWYVQMQKLWQTWSQNLLKGLRTGI